MRGTWGTQPVRFHNIPGPNSEGPGAPSRFLIKILLFPVAPCSVKLLERIAR